MKVELHHHTYDRLGCELLTDLVPLCRQHHAAVHRHKKKHGGSLLEAYDRISDGAPR